MVARLAFLGVLLLQRLLTRSGEDVTFYALMAIGFTITIPYSLWLRSRLYEHPTSNTQRPTSKSYLGVGSWTLSAGCSRSFYVASISMVLRLVTSCSCLGRVTVRTPFLKRALALSSCTWQGSGTVRWKEP